jgi:hypothetical protein
LSKDKLHKHLHVHSGTLYMSHARCISQVVTAMRPSTTVIMGSFWLPLARHAHALSTYVFAQTAVVQTSGGAEWHTVDWPKYRVGTEAWCISQVVTVVTVDHGGHGTFSNSICAPCACPVNVHATCVQVAQTVAGQKSGDAEWHASDYWWVLRLACDPNCVRTCGWHCKCRVPHEAVRSVHCIVQYR